MGRWPKKLGKINKSSDPTFESAIASIDDKVGKKYSQTFKAYGRIANAIAPEANLFPKDLDVGCLPDIIPRFVPEHLRQAVDSGEIDLIWKATCIKILGKDFQKLNCSKSFLCDIYILFNILNATQHKKDLIKMCKPIKGAGSYFTRQILEKRIYNIESWQWPHILDFSPLFRKRKAADIDKLAVLSFKNNFYKSYDTLRTVAVNWCTLRTIRDVSFVAKTNAAVFFEATTSLSLSLVDNLGATTIETLRIAYTDTTGSESRYEEEEEDDDDDERPRIARRPSTYRNLPKSLPKKHKRDLSEDPDYLAIGFENILKSSKPAIVLKLKAEDMTHVDLRNAYCQITADGVAYTVTKDMVVFLVKDDSLLEKTDAEIQQLVSNILKLAALKTLATEYLEAKADLEVAQARALQKEIVVNDKKRFLKILENAIISEVPPADVIGSLLKLPSVAKVRNKDNLFAIETVDLYNTDDQLTKFTGQFTFYIDFHQGKISIRNNRCPIKGHVVATSDIREGGVPCMGTYYHLFKEAVQIGDKIGLVAALLEFARHAASSDILEKLPLKPRASFKPTSVINLI